MFYHQKFSKSAFCKNALLNSTSFSPLNYWRKLLDVAELLSASKQSKKRPRKYKLKAEVSITPLLAALLAACSDENVPIGGTLDGTNVTTPTGEIPAQSFYLYVLDGAVEGALVYVDENANGQRDEDENEEPIGITDENGRVFIDAEDAGETFFIDASGAFDLFTGESLPSDTFYRAISDERGGSDVVASPISTIVQALRENDPAPTDAEILGIIFGANTQVDMDDLNNPDNFILPISDTEKPIDSPEAIAEEIASTSIQLQVLIEQHGGDLAAVLAAIGESFDISDLDQTSQDTANARIIEARERAGGDPIANPVTGTTATLNNDLALEMDVWGFRDPAGNRDGDNTPPSSFTRLNIVSITDGITTDVRGVLVHIADDGIETEYDARGEIPAEHFANLVFRPVADYLGRVEIIYTVFDGEDDSDEASLEIEVIFDPNAPVFTSSATASVNENITANDDGDTQGSAATIYTAIAAPDDAGDTVIYSLTSANDGDSFGINASTGTVWLRVAPDFETKSSYSFTVVASVTADGVTQTVSQIITLSVTDLNDNAPVFTSSATASVNENIAVNDDGDTQGSAATIYTAIAAPDDAGDTVSYSLTSANDGDSFGINASTGDVWFRAAPDHENKSSYSFTVVASVTADGVTQTATRIVTLSVTDLNDNAPVFTSSATASVNENIAVNDDGDTQGSAATIYTAIAAPDDAGDTVIYSLTSANDGDSFGINASTGDVWFRAAPDHENKSSYSFTVVASVTADGVTHSESQIITLSVTDLNDNAPVFTSSATASVNENIAANDDGDTQGSAATIYTAIAAPDDAGDTVIYSLTSANDGDSFGINASTGTVWFRAAPDHENKSSYSFTVVASVTADGVTQTATRIVTLSVTDLNDNAPVFTSSATASVNENITANDDGDTQGSAATIYTAIAAPDDAGDTVSYSLTSANDGDSFGINASTGTVWFRAAPDFETKSSYSFTVVASVTADGVTQTATRIVTLSVTDLNDNAPVFTSSATASVNENIAANDDGDTQGSAATIYTAIAAPDDAGDTVIYSLTSANDGDSFGINASTGTVWFRAAPDHETKSSYSFTVVASVTADGVTQTATRIVTLSVTDLNDNAPVFTSSATASVNENIAANDSEDTQGSAATIYTAIAAPDDAGDTVIYSLTSANDGDSFGINASTGDVWFRAAPDHENKSSYSFTVVASVTADGVTHSESQIITLSVTDLNDNAPVFTSSATASVNENIAANDDGDTQGSAATIYTAIAAPDDAGDTVSYSLTSANDGDSFGINASTGTVWLRSPPDHENKSSYSFTVVASVTADGVTHSESQIITLSVTDLNDNAPVFTSSATASVNENIAANDDGDTQGSAATIYTAIAAPDDAGDTVIYSLTSANDGDSFGINASTGDVWFRAAPDHENKSSYSFTVVASVTADGVTHSESQIITLSVTDLNDNAPVFTSSATASVNENIAANDDGDTQGSAATIYTAIAAPDDAGDTVSYSLTSANDGDSFGINASTGTVWFRAAPDHENKSSYSFTVVASVTADGVTQTATRIVTLSVTDLNDNAPVFTSSATASVNENIAVNDDGDTQGSAATIYTAIAAPDDAGDTVSYSLTSANDGDSFGINASTGDVWFRAAPDHENKSSYSFTVVASVTADGVTQTATRIVTLSVTDLNDNAPVFTSSATASVNENIAVNDDGDTQGSAATIYTAIAAPDDAGDTVSYSLTSANDGDSFGINASTGTVWLRSPPDHENKSSYSFRVVASVTADGVTQTATSNLITLSINDLNDNAPVFTSSVTASVNENIAANDDGDTQGSAATIYTAIAAPDDAGDTVSYSLTSANDGDSFGINASTGTVWFRAAPDHENKSSYSFTVVASVTADGVTQTATRIVTLSVTDLNDNAPVFTSSATASVNENIAANDDGDTQGSAATIYTAIAAPDDAGDTVSYSLTSANDGDSFGINASTGTVWLRVAPDFETKSSYSFTVVASVTADGVTQTATRIVTLSVTDLNDNAPVFTSSATASVNENIAANDDADTQGSAATIYTAIAAPDDAGDTVIYSLTSANDGDSFGINASTGIVWFRAAPDHENKASYSFTVVASVTADGVTHSASQIITLSVTDLNDNAPVFTSSATASVNENIAANDDGDTQGSAATIYTAIAAPDDAGDTVSYSLTSANDGDSFGINASTGDVWFRAAPDHENKSSYSFTVVASVTADGVTQIATRIVTLSVTDLNDNAPVFTSSATASVNENIAANDDGDTQGSAATIYTAIAAPDDAGDTVSYSLTSANDGDSFGINASTGTVWFRAAPDFETKSSYSFTVVASVTADGVTQTATRIVTLSVTDLNDNAPVFTSSATASVNENIAVNDDGDTQGSAATIYTAIAAPDDAGDTVSYSLTSANDGDSFGINASTGIVWFRAAPDHETKSSYSFTVVASVTADGVTQTATRIVTLSVTDLNDNAPVFTSSATASVNENITANDDGDTQGSAATIYTAIAAPDDAGDTVSYSLTSANDGDSFGINASTGTVWLRAAPDHENKSSYSFTVVASVTADGVTQTATRIVTLSVTDLNDNAPVFTSSATASVNENIAANDDGDTQGSAATIYTAIAAPDDAGDTVSYSLTSANDGDSFGINASTGTVWLRSPPDHENKSSYSFTVVASVTADGVTQTATRIVTLSVTDLNDNAPVFTSSATASVNENIAANDDGDTQGSAATIYTAIAAPDDAGDTVSYSLTSANDGDSFGINASTGDVWFRAAPDFETKSSYSFTVVASVTADGVTQTATRIVTLSVTDLNDNAPVFTSSATASVNENIAVNDDGDTQGSAATIYTAIAAPDDAGDTVSYSLTSANDGDSFGINASTGTVWLRSPPDHENKSSYSFTVVASVTADGVTQTATRIVTLSVTDLNDNAPVFTSSATASVNENITVNDDGDTQGSAATIYTAIAAPDDAGDTVSYSLTSANDGDSFGINASTGDVWFRAAPDHENKSSYSFTVVASVTADGVTQTATRIVTLSVTDLNDNAPVFTSSATASVNENIAVNDDGDTQGSAATIYTAIAAPDDAGDTVSYSLTSANDGDSFGINASTGTVWFRAAPDHENKSSYSFTVVASVTADGVTQTATRIVTLSVTDLNDNAPVFTSSATASVNENIAVNDDGDTQGSAATIYTAIAAPDDAGDTVSYSLTSANDGDSFGINASTGTVWLRVAPDFETKSSYSFTVVASVTADGVTQTATRIVTLSVTDLNDNAPVFTSSATASVNENIAANDDGDTQGSAATIYTAIAAPDDAGDTVSYSLTSANDGDSFGINASTGTVWFRAAPDHENKSSYSFTVVASVTADGVTHSASQIITLSVTDLNDNAPVFTSSATASVNENIAVNDDGDTQGSAATIYTAIAAPDDAGDTVSYSLTSANDGDSFGINASTGTVWFRAAPDHENKSSYSFTVVASVTADGVTQTATRIVTLSVTDLNDNAPVFTSSATASVNENIAVNDDGDTQGSAATIYTAIAAPDDAGDTVSYSLTSANDGDSFGINASTGTVWLRSPPDHENKSSYSFRVVASVTADGVTQTATSNLITLSINDLNDNAPVFTSSVTASVNENIAANDDGDTQGSAATIYTAIAAPDDAGDTVSYSLTSANDGDSFGINASTGTVWFRAAPDHENKSSYSFTVVASVTADGVTQTATRIVTLSVTDLNDNAPVFTSSATASVNENIAANDDGDTQGSAATIYTAIAAPDDAGDTVSYSLTSANDGDSFGINASTGTVWLRVAPDFETKSSYSFTVVASVTADGVTQTATRIVTLSVTDLNDNAPVFTSSATASVNENIAANDDADTQGSAATIYTAIAAPDDAGDTVIYSLTSANDGDSFGINASTGIVWFRAAPDHENKASYSFTVVASVTADGVTHSASQIITLSVTDLNDNAPVFTSSATASVNENIAANDDGDTQGSAATIYTAIAAPDDAGDTVIYSLTSANDGDSFGINASTGTVWLRVAPDHENKSSYSFTVVASVTADGVTQTATRIVTLSVTDLNDNAPVFTSSATASVNENIAVNDDGDTQGSAATIYTAIAAPDDAGDTVIYSLTSANDGDSFGINASTGTVWLRSPPDHENKSSYSFTVVASVTADGVTHSASQIITLSVTDLNDNAPVFTSSATASVNENIAVNDDGDTQGSAATIYTAIAAPDDAGDTVSYSLTSANDGDSFGINASTGTVWFRAAPDHENKSSYSFTVVASVTADGVTQIATRIVTLSITDLNDNAPVFTSSATASVNENIAANDDGDTQGSAATIYTAIAAPDDAGDTVSYSLTSANDGDSFGINASTGDVWFRAAPDHENKSSYSFTVVASVTADGVTQIATRIVTLSVTDLNDNAPVFTSSATASVNENIAANDDGDTQGSAATIYTAIAAPDDAGDTVSYSLTSANDGDSFGINASTGTVWFRAAPDFETKSSYSFTVVASVTADGVTQTATRIVTLSVTDLNDNAPVFTSSATASVNENIAVNDDGDTQGSAATIYTAIAAPDDAGDTVSYSLTSANDGDSFGINASTGIVWFRAAPDHETKSSYSFTVVASVTADGVTQTATRIVTLSVTDLNDNAPVFTSSATASVNENITANDDGDTQGSAATIYTAIAAPDDAGDTVSYSLTSANDGDSFGINASTGTVWLRVAPDHENKSSYSFTVVASVTADGVTHSASQIITLSVTDLNDNAPVFTSSATASVNENIAANDAGDTQGSAATIYTAIAAPDDAGDTVSYSLTSANDGDSFGINASTGAVWFRAAPDHENKSSYSFTVVASVTADGVTQTATRIVTLSVTDLNDNAPVFTSDATAANVNENITANDDGDTQGSAATIYTAIAAPDDAGDTVSYSLTSANDGDSFGINASTGTVWLRSPPDHENKSSYSFTVVASVTADGVTQTATRIVTLSVTDLNDNAPVFTSSATASVNENITANDDGDTQGSAATIYTAIAAPDDAGDTVSYSLTSANDGDSFGINASTGTVWFRSPPDHENKSSYSFTVVASVTADGVTQTATRIVTLSVTDLNDNPPVFTSSATASVNENIAANDDGDTQGSAATIYTAIAAPDDAGDTVSYSLTSANDGDSFGINASTGIVWFRAAPDHESGKTSYSFTVVASVTADGLTHTTTRIVTLSVTDLNDNAPVFTSSATASVNENITANDDGDTQGSAATIYTAIAAPDDAGDTVSYSLTSANDGDSFGINASTGIVWFRAAPDHENKSSYSFTVVASVTADGVTQTATRIVTLSVTDLNDNAPVFTSSATASVNENIAANDDGDTQGSAATIYTAIAAPDDAGDTVSYSLTSANDGDSFGINASTGTVWLRSPPDHENKSSYSFTVVASVTADGVTQTATRIVTLSVTDLNDNAPVFTSSATASVNENIAANDDGDTQGSAATIYTAIAAPDDAGDTVSYSLTSANDGDSFGINASTGTVWFRSPPDFETKSSYSFTVVASVTADGVTLTSDRNITLSINDLDENAPTLTSAGTVQPIAENIATQTDTGVTLTPADVEGDTFNAGSFTVYEGTDTTASTRFGVIEDNTGVFRLVLRANNPLNFETEQTINLRVVVSDGTLTSEAVDVTVTVTDENDAPTLTLRDTDVAVRESGEDDIGDAVDADLAANGVLIFGDAETSLTNLSVFIGNTDAMIANIQTPLSRNASTETTVMINGDASNSNGDAYGQFTFKRATDGTVTWAYILDDDAANGLTAGQTATDSVWVRVNDGISNSSVEQITVTITGTNDPPTLTNNGSRFAYIAETATSETDTGISFTASDDDTVLRSNVLNQNNTSVLSSRFALVFEGISDGSDGSVAGDSIFKLVLLPGAIIDFETEPRITLWVGVYDPSFAPAWLRLFINITDVANHPLLFRSADTAEVDENIAANNSEDTQGSAATIYTAIATLDDAGDTVVYSLTSANDGDSFGINASTGTVWFRTSPDFETKSSYSFTVTATVTVGTDIQTESQEVTVNITDVNDRPITRADAFANPHNIAETATFETDTGIIIYASDQDDENIFSFITPAGTPRVSSSRFALVFEGISDGSDGSVAGDSIFKLVLLPGAVFDFETEPTIMLHVGVYDDSFDVHRRVLTINITDVANHPLLFRSADTAEVDENIAANDDGDTQGSAETIYTAVATPDDAGDTVSYSLTSANDGDSFGINASTGTVWFRTSPDHENKSSYSFTVVASVTADGVTLTRELTVTLTLNNLNDNIPTLDTPNGVAGEIAENIADETDTGITFTPADLDGVTFGVASFTVSESDNVPTRFGVIDDNGVFKLVLLRGNALNFETEQTINLRVVVSDGTFDSEAVDVTVTVTDVNDAPTVSLGDTDDLVVNEAGSVYVAFNLFLNIKFTPKPGTNPSGINFTHTFDANSNVANGTFIIKMDSPYDEVEIFDNSDSPSYTYDHIINQFNVAQQDETRYMTALLFAGDGHIAYPLFRILGFGRDRSGLYSPTPRDDIPADLAANGVLNISDAETSLTNLSVFIGNTDATISNITEEIEAGTPRTIAGMGVSDAIADGVYGSFTLTRSADDGSVTWNYTLNEDAVNALGDGQTATDSVWVRVQDDDLASTVQEIKVLITGANDAPTLTSAGTVQPIAENIATQTDTGVTLTPADVDVNTTFDADSFTVYEVTNGTADTDISSRFRVVAGDDADNDNDYKLVLLAGQLTDYEIEPTIRLNVNVTDGVNVSDTVEVTVTLTDELDSPPVFSSAEAAAVDENIEANNNASVQGTAATIYTAEITANLTYDTIIYSLLDTDEGNDFGIDGTSGNVWFKFSPDYEDEDEREYTFTVQAVATADGMTQAAERTVTLSVNNLNDNRPVFTSGSTASVNENIEANNNASVQGTAMTVYRVAAIPDVAGHTVSYSLMAANDGASFGIDGTSGNVWFREPPDYEDITEREYKFTVQASVTADGVTQIRVRFVTLSVTDLNDNPPALTSSTTASVNENVAANNSEDTQGSAMMVYRAFAIPDVAGHTVSYSINTSAPIYQDASFGIDSSSGIVWLLESPDHETQSSYLFRVVASVTADGVTQTATSNLITLSINDLHDAPPVFTSGSTASVNENIAANNNATNQGGAMTVYRAAARPDIPGHTVSYSLTSANQGDLFGIDSSIGFVWLRASPDYETRSLYSFTVVASVTADGVTLTSDRNITLSINDLNDNAPTVNTAHADYDVTDTYESGDLEAASGRWVVEDADEGDTLSYDVQAQGTYGTLRFGTDGNWGYAIDTTSTDIQNLNEPTTLTDTITVRATDEAGVFVDGTVTVIINDAINTLYVNGTSGDDGSLGDAAATDQQIIQGGDGTDFLRGGTADDILIGGAGNDTISLNHGGNDTVIYRIASTDDGLFGLDGADTIDNLNFTALGVDRLVFVDTDDTPLGSFADLLELGKGTDAPLTVSLIPETGGTGYLGMVFTFLGDTTTSTDDATLTLNFKDTLIATDANGIFGINGIDTNNQLNDLGFVSFSTSYGNTYDVVALEEFGLEII